MSQLEQLWIEVFRAGDYGDKGRFEVEDLDRLAVDYDPAAHEAPVVIGHPAEDAPAWGWVEQLRRAGNSLWAKLRQVQPEFEDMVRRGLFKQRSVALYPQFEKTGRPYLRHLGFLGAVAPQVKGLQPVQFGDAEHIEFAVTFEDKPMPDEKQATSEKPAENGERKATSPTLLERARDLLRQLVELLGVSTEPAEEEAASAMADSFQSGPAACPEPGRGAPAAGGSDESPDQELTALRQRLAAATEANRRQSTAFAEEQRRQQITAFVARLQAEGKWLPAFEKAYGLETLMQRLASSSVSLTFAETKNGQVIEVERPAVEVLERFLTDLPQLVRFDHISGKARTAAARGGRLAFTEPREAKQVVGIDTHSRVMALIRNSAKNGKAVTYSEAYRLVRAEEREAGLDLEA